MVQGTTSDAGKSTVVTGLCRVLLDLGVNVVPFKPQNMALNSAVTEDGGEIGRAQAVQAQACGLEAHTDMNPVLIKPSSDTGAQIIIHGQVKTNMNAQEFHDFKPKAKIAVLASHQRLREQYDVVIVEGAGSPAEINLRKNDIANMGFAEAVDCPVILVADIDKGGVFAHLVGTLELLSSTEKNRVIGFVINKFRGDIALLESGLKWLEERTGKPVLGVLPYLHEFYLEAEDAIDNQQCTDSSQELLKVVVPAFPRISNHTDLDALRQNPAVDLVYVKTNQIPPACDLIVLPGSKSVINDLAWLRDNGWVDYLQKHLRYGGKIIGICGGYQMLGKSICDEEGVESKSIKTPALGFIPIATVFEREKKLVRKRGLLNLDGRSETISGYEIHHGVSVLCDDAEVPDKLRPEHNDLGLAIEYEDGTRDGYLSEDSQIFGCYLHGLFDEPGAGQQLLRWAGIQSEKVVDIRLEREKQIDRVAKTVKEYIDLEKIESLIQSQKYSSASITREKQIDD